MKRGRSPLIREIAVVASVLSAAVPCPGFASGPGCEQPARLEGKFNARTPGVTVEFKRSVPDTAAAAAALAEKYGFRITTQFSWGGIYIWNISAETIDALRCEPQVEMIEYNEPSSSAERERPPGT